jgi:hypothetical protein
MPQRVVADMRYSQSFEAVAKLKSLLELIKKLILTILTLASKVFLSCNLKSLKLRELL